MRTCLVTIRTSQIYPKTTGFDLVGETIEPIRADLFQGLRTVTCQKNVHKSADEYRFDILIIRLNIWITQNSSKSSEPIEKERAADKLASCAIAS